MNKGLIRIGDLHATYVLRYLLDKSFVPGDGIPPDSFQH
jgi:hypothetical protein